MTDVRPSEELMTLVLANETARTICDHIAQRKRRPAETTASQLREITECREREAIPTLKLLAKVGFGAFKKGRSKKDGTANESRILWCKDAITIARSLYAGATANGTAEATSKAGAQKSAITTQSFAIRPGCVLLVPVLPDLTAAERDRYAAFVQSLYSIEDAA